MTGKREAVKSEAPKEPQQPQEPQLNKDGVIDYGDQPYVHPDIQKVLDGGTVTHNSDPEAESTEG